jgi:basic membrane protein A
LTTLTKKSLAGFAVFGAAALVLAGCAGGAGEAEVAEEAAEPAAEETVEAAPEVDFLACAVSDEGSWNDKSFNESVYDGLQQAEAELGVQIADAESNTPEDFAPNLQAMVDASCDVIFAVGFNLVADVNAAAAANPDVHFVTIDGWSEGNANLKPVGYLMNQSSYMAGYLAAAYSTTKTIGTYGGMQIDAVTDFMTGYYNGAMAYAEETGTAVTVVGWDPAAATGDFIGDFAPNSATSKSIAAAQLEKGADVLFPVGGDQFGAGSEAIQEAGVDAVMIGVDKDIAATSEEYAPFILTSAEKRMGEATFNIIADLASGAEFSGDAYIGTLENVGTALSPFYGFDAEIPAEVKTRLDEIKAGIIDGSIDPLA